MAAPKKTPRNKGKDLNPKAKFLVFIDESEQSEVALHFGCCKAGIKDRPVEMLFVINPMDYNTIFSVSDVMKQDRHAEVKKYLHDLAKKAKEWTGITPTIHIREGSVYDEVISCIEADSDINMLIISSNPAQSSGGSKLIGDLAAELDERLHIPMMIVPAHLTDQQIEELT